MTLLAGCGEKKIVHCDGCGKECKIAADSPMEEDWIIYCSDCEKKLGLDKVVQDGDVPPALKQEKK